MKTLLKYWKTLQTQVPQSIEGQLWWDKSDVRLKVYEGPTFKAVGGSLYKKEQLLWLLVIYGLTT